MAIPKDAVREQLKTLEYRHTFFNGSELRRLPQIIREGERMLAISRGKHEGSKWLVVATSQRLLLLDKGVMYGVKQVELPIVEIQTIQHSTGLFSGELTITTASGVKKIAGLRRKGAQAIADIVSRQIYSSRQANPAGPVAGGDTISQLERLQKLRDSGVLTPEEFQAQKQRILGRAGQDQTPVAGN